MVQFGQDPKAHSHEHAEKSNSPRDRNRMATNRARRQGRPVHSRRNGSRTARLSRSWRSPPGVRARFPSLREQRSSPWWRHWPYTMLAVRRRQAVDQVMTTSITLDGHRNRHVRRMAVRSLRVRQIWPECRRPAPVDLRAALCSPAASGPSTVPGFNRDRRELLPSCRIAGLTLPRYERWASSTPRGFESCARVMSVVP